MSRFRSICLTVIAYMLLSSQVMAAPASRQIKLYEGESGLTLSLENGSTGILTIHYVMVMPARTARISSYVLFADPFKFTAFATAVFESSGPVVADLDGTAFSIRLSASSSGNRMYGHIIGSNARVYVVPGPR